MAKYTKFLVIFSVVLSFFSLYSIKNGGREFYPFYSWKLFTSPSGSNEFEKEYRLYGVKSHDTIRISNNVVHELYDENEKFAIINSFGNQIAQNKDVEKNKKRLLHFGQMLDSSFQEYLLVEETYKAKDLDKRDFCFVQKKIITSLR